MSTLQRRILVVEDDRTIAESVAARLRAEGFAVDLAHDGPSAVARASALRPDLVVLDIMLPGFDGLEVCRRIQAERPVPVLMLTARGDETDLLVGLAVGADDYLTKPFSIRELAARPRTVLPRERLLADVWGWADASGTRTVDSHIKGLRRKLGADLIRTVHGVGYALEVRR